MATKKVIKTTTEEIVEDGKPVREKVVKKSVSRKRTSRVTKKRATSKERNEDLLIKNFISLQKVMTRMTTKFEELTDQISELLNLFEESAKVVVKSELMDKKDNKESKRIYETMSSILDQNKVIAQGLTMMYEHLSEPTEPIVLRDDGEKNEITIAGKPLPSVTHKEYETLEPDYSKVEKKPTQIITSYSGPTTTLTKPPQVTNTASQSYHVPEISSASNLPPVNAIKKMESVQTVQPSGPTEDLAQIRPSIMSRDEEEYKTQEGE